MAPKFRGDGDDWLDDQSSRKSRRKPSARPEFLAAELGTATVAEVFPKQCRVIADDGAPLACAYRRALVIGPGGPQEGTRERAPVAVGDRVRHEKLGDGTGVITGICVRKNQLARAAPDRDLGVIHVLVANLDLLVVVAAARDPAFSPGLVDRFLVAASAQGIPALICVNKCELDLSDRPWSVYTGLGFEVQEVSARQRQGIEKLRARLSGKAVAFCGHSGVGKTSLLRELLGQPDFGKVGEVSELTGKGKHTTTSAVLLGGPEGSRWIDTPGVREFGLHGMAPESLLGFFPELQAASRRCAPTGCSHAEDSVGCALRELERYPSYRRLLASLEEAAAS